MNYYFKKIFIVACCFWSNILLAQNFDSPFFANKIDTPALRHRLEVLASDSLEGRETGTEGIRRAARFLAQEFQKMGLPAVGDSQSFFQNVRLTAESWEHLSLSVGEKNFTPLMDFYSFPRLNQSEPEPILASEVVFLGYGIDDVRYSDFRKKDVRNKIILVCEGEPVRSDGFSYISQSKEKSVWAMDEQKKLAAAQRHGARAVFFLKNNFSDDLNEARKVILNTRMSVEQNKKILFANSLHLSEATAAQIAGDKMPKIRAMLDEIRRSGKPDFLRIPCDLKLILRKKINVIEGQNVIGFVEGTDSVLKKEIIVLSAHYDHLGKRGTSIFHGADDDGSGTTSVVAMCEAFALAKKQGVAPRRSVLCLLFTGEEKGLLGSKYYTANPIFSLQNTVADLNIDMIGRIDDSHAANPNYLYVIGSKKLSTELHQINETANQNFTHLALDYSFDEPDEPNRYYYRSDHYNFAEQNIPIIFYFDGSHKDYHRPTDTVDKIDFKVMKKRAQLIFSTAWQLANQPNRIKLDDVK